MGGRVCSFLSKDTSSARPKNGSDSNEQVRLHVPEVQQNSIKLPHAIARIRRLRGGSQPQLLLCSDGFYYVVKFQNNPHGCRSLACDLLGTLLAIELGLPIQPVAVIWVNDDFVAGTPDMYVQKPNGIIRYQSGLCFGSRYPCDIGPNSKCELAAVNVDFPTCHNNCFANDPDFAGMLIFDQWTCNIDQRQIIFWRTMRSLWCQASMIDQDQCFGGERWSFTDLHLWGLYQNPRVYSGFKNFDVFEPWLWRLEHKIDEATIWSAGLTIPPAWYDGDAAALDRLLEELNERRKGVRELIWQTIRRSPHWFPHCRRV